MSQISEVDLPEFVDGFFRRCGRGRFRLAVLTYQFDPQEFETRFQRVFRYGGIRVDVVVGDQPKPPRREPYFVWRAAWPGTFHPKLLFLLANNEVAVGLGSANMTRGGLRGNLECWQFFEKCNAEQPLLGSLRSFFEKLKAGKIVSPVFEIDELIHSLPSTKLGPLLSTLNGQILSQVASLVSQPAVKLDVLSPVNCDPGKLVLQLRKTFGIRKVNLYTNMTAEKVPAIRGCDRYHDLAQPENSEEEDKTVRRYDALHAKMYGFYSKKGVDVFWGSANLSASAWLRVGRTANVDFLVHSRLTELEWRNLRDGLPAAHYWQEVPPAKLGVLPKEPPPKPQGWSLLNASWDGRKLLLEASRPGIQTIWLRTPAARKLRLKLNFRSGQTKLSTKIAGRLGISAGPLPDALEYALRERGPWQRIAVNVMNRISAGSSNCDVAELLFWRYTGRLLPGSFLETPRVACESGEDAIETLDHEEEELTKSAHQGALDRFVLQWRLNVRRITACSGNNFGLMRQRFEEAKRLISTEAEQKPEKWPRYRLEFVSTLFQQALREA